MARSAAANHGVFTLAMARAAGLSDSTVSRRQHEGIYKRILEGVYCHAGTPPSWPRDAAAAVAWAGDWSALSGISAAAARGFDGFARIPPIDISTARGKRSPASWVRVRRRDELLSSEIEERGPLPIVSIRRMLLDLAGDKHPRVEAALDHALRDDPDELQRLWGFLDDPRMWGRRGMAILGAHVRARTAGTAPSDGELTRMMRTILRRYGIPQPLGEYEVRLPFSEIHIDLAYPERLLGIECDSRGWHMNALSFERDRERDVELAKLGWLILRFTWAMMKFRPDWVAETVAYHLRTRALVG